MRLFFPSCFFPGKTCEVILNHFTGCVTSVVAGDSKPKLAMTISGSPLIGQLCGVSMGQVPQDNACSRNSR